MRRSLAMLISLAAMVHTADAQQVTVQQPSVGATGVATSVLVPDQGRILLEGVTSAQSSRSRYGFAAAGSSIGLSRSSRSLTAGVRIIDLRELDEALLNSVNSGSDQTPGPWARHAAAISAAAPSQLTKTTSNADVAPADRAARFEQLARHAEARNQPGVAKLHWQIAAKYGSTTARERLANATAD